MATKFNKPTPVFNALFLSGAVHFICTVTGAHVEVPRSSVRDLDPEVAVADATLDECPSCNRPHDFFKD